MAMDIGQNVRRIKDNLFLIPEARFDELVKDTEYVTSFIYLVGCMVLSVPFTLIVSLVTGKLFADLFALPISFTLGIILSYVGFVVFFVFLKLVGGKASLLQSVQMFIYGATLSLIVSGIPCIGALLSLISLANVVIGSARIHKITLLRAIIALIVLPFVLFGLVLVAIAVVGALIGTSALAGLVYLLRPG